MKYNKKLKRSLEKTPKFSQTMKRFKSNKTVSFLMAAVLKVLRDEHGFGAVRLQKFSTDVLKQLVGLVMRLRDCMLRSLENE